MAALLLCPPKCPSSGFPTKTLYTFLFCPMRATFPVHIILLDLINLRMFHRGQQAVDTLMQLSPDFSYFLPPRSRYSPQRTFWFQKNKHIGKNETADVKCLISDKECA
jgi:hypothetical protein